MAIDSSKPWRQTPLIESTVLSKAAGWSLNRRSRIFLKLENLQPSGSFKQRGIGLYCTEKLRQANDPSSVTFYASSAGNAGLACVHAAKALGRPAYVVAPKTTSPVMVAKLRAAGASDVFQHGANWKEADAHMREVIMVKALQKGEEPVYVPPFDHETIWQGHSSLVDELHEQMRSYQSEAEFRANVSPAPDVIACSVGGGGLLAGIMMGMATPEYAEPWSHTTALAVETQGAESFAASLNARRLVTLPSISSIATSLGCSRIAPGVYDIAAPAVDAGKLKYAVLSDAEAAMGCWRLADDERILTEPACGVTISLAYGGRLQRALGREVAPEEKVVIVLCGGSNTSLSMVEKWREQYGDLDDESTRIRGFVNGDVPSAFSAPRSPVTTAPRPIIC